MYFWSLNNDYNKIFIILYTDKTLQIISAD